MEIILILHGWGSSSRNWSQVKDLLEKRGHKVFAPDLPGFGESPPPLKPWSVDDYMNWVKDYCDKEALSQIFLLGHSFGGGVAAKFTGNFPERVKGLILVSPAIRRRKTLKQLIFLGLAKMGNLIFTTPVLSWLQPVARKVLYMFAGTRDYYKLDIKKAVTMKESFKKIVDEDLTYCLPKIQVPTLIIWGAKDKVTPTNEANLIKNGIKKAELEIIDDSQHGLNLEKPEILAEKILDFIK